MIHFLEEVFGRPFLGRLRHFTSVDELVETLINISSAFVDLGGDRDAEAPNGTGEVLR